MLHFEKSSVFTWKVGHPPPYLFIIPIYFFRPHFLPPHGNSKSSFIDMFPAFNLGTYSSSFLHPEIQGHAIKNQDLLLASGAISLKGSDGMSEVDDDVQAAVSAQSQSFAPDLLQPDLNPSSATPIATFILTIDTYASTITVTCSCRAFIGAAFAGPRTHRNREIDCFSCGTIQRPFCPRHRSGDTS